MYIVFLEVITGILILKYVYGFIKDWIYPKPVMSHLHQEVRDLMQSTQQIKENWSEVIGIMDRVRDRQSHLFANIQTMTRNLCDESRRLELVDKRGGDLREEARLYVDTVDALAAKLVKMREAARQQAEALVEELDLVEDSEVSIVSDDEPVKDAIAVVKKVLKNFVKENRKNMNSEKEDMKKNVRGMTDGLKESIVSALTEVVTSETEQQPSITTENQETVRVLSTKMLGIDDSLKRAAIDVSSTKGILDTIDSHLDEIYGKLELDKKAMNKQSRESSAKMITVVEEVDRQAVVLDETGAALAKVIAGVPPSEEEVRKKVEEVSEMLHRFATKVEVPMKMLVSNMRFLYESTVCRSKHPPKDERNYERGDVPYDEAVKMVEEKVQSLMKEFRMRTTRNRKGLSRPVQDLFDRQAPQVMHQSASLEMSGKAVQLKSS